MKISDKKFASKVAANGRTGLSDEQKQQLKAAVNPSVAAEELFDKLGQMMMQPDIMQPQLGLPQGKPKQIIPKFDGMWDKRKLKREFKRLRSMGLSDEDAVARVIEMGGAGAGADSGVVRDYLKALYHQSVSLQPFDEWLYKEAASGHCSPRPGTDIKIDPLGGGKFNVSGTIDGAEFSGQLTVYIANGTFDGWDYTSVSGFDVSTDEEALQTLLDCFENDDLSGPEYIGHEAGLGGDTLSTEEIEGTGKIGQMGAPQTPAPGPAAPMPAPAPQDMGMGMQPEEEMPLDEAIQQLDEAARIVVEKVQNGESIINGENAVPSEPMDTGAIPAPSPKVAQSDDPDLTPEQKEKDEVERLLYTPEERKLLNIEQDKWRKTDPFNQDPYRVPDSSSGPVAPGTLRLPGNKPMSKDQLRNLILEKQKQLKSLTDSGESVAPKKENLNMVRPSDIKVDDKQISQERGQITDKKLTDLNKSIELSNEEAARQDKINEQIRRIKFIMDSEGENISPEILARGEAKIKELQNQLKGLQDNKKSNDPVAVIDRQNGPFYTKKLKELVDSGMPPEQAAQVIDNMRTIDIFDNMIKREVPQAGRGKRDDVPVPQLKPIDVALPDDVNNINVPEEGGSGKSETPEPKPHRDRSKMLPGQDIMEFAPDRGKMAPGFKGGPQRPGKEVTYQQIVPAALPGIDNVDGWIKSLPRQYKDKPKTHTFTDASGKSFSMTEQAPLGLDMSKITQDDINKMKQILEIMYPAYKFNQSQISKGVQMGNKEKGIGKSVKPTPQVKKSVDQDAKDYWTDYMHEYGDMLTKDRVASIVDAVEDIFNRYNIDPASDRFDRIVAFLADNSEVPFGSKYANVISFCDDKIATLVDKVIANHIIKYNLDSAFENGEIPSVAKSSIFISAAHEAGIKDRLLSFVADKMKVPKVNGQPDDEVKVDSFDKDEANSKKEELQERMEVEVDDIWVEGDYVHISLKWDDSGDRSEEGVMHAIKSHVKGLESQKDNQDIGFIGKIHLVDFDMDAGVAEVMFQSTMSGSAPLKTAQAKDIFEFFPNQSQPCGCENSACAHTPQVCMKPTVEGDATALYVGRICHECAQLMDKDFMYPPHGTARDEVDLDDGPDHEPPSDRTAQSDDSESHHNLERQTWQEFRKTLKKRPGKTVLMCPKCTKVVKEYDSEINALNEYAYKDGVSYAYDGRGCCF